ncbi:c-type cytochrome [Bradyrhizobium huanghuaihaiense]|uniref:c-type cytochrome n=1 Tax=Bradyrhizobium huanghuaihaiense TaxID=990078 RepID=UPI0021AA3F42|nr:c-type cytochrome [Bradyrhizobium sp. CB3035]UWU78041.1 c-type cytochrome [Bradyrhizobium sp. CB3035]
MRVVVLGLCTAMVLVARVADAQMPLPAAKPPDGATLFKQQCAVCHTLSLSEPMRQGPPLVKVVGRPAGKAEGFKYSEAMSKADFAWDETRLDAWLANPQAVIPGVIMAYWQAKPETRAAIIAFLREQN